MKSYKEMSPLTRVWVYQADREFTAAERKTIGELTGVFVQHWESHGKPVNGTIEIFYSRFLVLFIDEQDDQSCGRSVDASVRFMKELEQELGVKLLDRMLVAYRKGGTIYSCTLAEFENRLAAGEVDENTIVFNNTVHTITEFLKNWEVPLSMSWHSRLLPH